MSARGVGGRRGALVPNGLRASRLTIEGHELVVLSFERPGVYVPCGVTGAERDVLERIVAGESNSAIARARGVSPSTVANQVNSLFRKLGVGSRAELAQVIVGDG